MLHVDWYIEQRVILANVGGDLTIDEVRALNDQLVALIDQGQQPVHIIVDVSGVTTIPTNLLKMRDASHVMGHIGAGWIVAVGLHNSFMNFIGSMLTQLGHLARYRVMPDANAAYTHLRTVDASLPAHS